MEPTTLNPVMTAEPIPVPGVISGATIVSDLCGRIAAKLSQDCSLRESDAYSGYSAQVEIVLQLHDVYPLQIVATTAVGSIDPHLPVAYLDLAPEVTAAESQPSLERSVDGSLPEADPRFRRQPSLDRPIDPGTPEPARVSPPKARRDFLSDDSLS